LTGKENRDKAQKDFISPKNSFIITGNKTNLYFFKEDKHP
jgi:hypothetical protein